MVLETTLQSESTYLRFESLRIDNNYLIPPTPTMEMVARGAAFIMLPVAWIFRSQGRIVFVSV